MDEMEANEILINGKTLRALRGLLGMSQAELSKLMRYKNPSYISRLESEQATLSKAKSRLLLEQTGLSKRDIAKVNKFRHEIRRKSNLTKGEYYV